MKRFLVLVLFFAVLAVSLSAQASITRFAVVDMDRIIAAFTDKAAIQAYNEKQEQVKAEIEKQNRELEELKIKLEEAKGKRNNTKQIQALENEISAKTLANKTYSDSMKAELEKDWEKLQSRINMEQITRAIRFVAEAEGCSMVLPKGSASILWSSPSIDITIKVLNRLSGGGR